VGLSLGKHSPNTMNTNEQCTHILNDQYLKSRNGLFKVTLNMRITDLESARQTWRLDRLDFVMLFYRYELIIQA